MRRFPEVIFCKKMSRSIPLTIVVFTTDRETELRDAKTALSTAEANGTQLQVDVDRLSADNATSVQQHEKGIGACQHFYELPRDTWVTDSSR